MLSILRQCMPLFWRWVRLRLREADGGLSQRLGFNHKPLVRLVVVSVTVPGSQSDRRALQNFRRDVHHAQR